MSLPRRPQQSVYTPSNGNSVCYDHHLRRCDRCRLDFSLEDSYQNEPGYYGFDEHGEEEENSHDQDRVDILEGSRARFTPQWDADILGFANAPQIPWNHNNPPKALALSNLQTHYCSTCQLTWLVGEQGEAAAQQHPSHPTCFHVKVGTCRSLLVFTDGACSNNGYQVAQAGLGVFFGPGSRFNLSERVTMSDVSTNQKAELEAAARALEVVRETVIPHRRRIIENAVGSHNVRAVSDVKYIRVIIVTDSSYLVECMCKHMLNWEQNAQGFLFNKQGKPIANSQAFLRLQNAVGELSMVGVQVAYYHVGREENQEADALAKESIAGGRWY